MAELGRWVFCTGGLWHYFLPGRRLPLCKCTEPAADPQPPKFSPAGECVAARDYCLNCLDLHNAMWAGPYPPGSRP